MPQRYPEAVAVLVRLEGSRWRSLSGSGPVP